MSDLLEDVYSFPPASFLAFSAEIVSREGLPESPYKKPWLLPEIQDFLDEDAFAKVAMCFDIQGFYMSVRVDKPFEDVSFAPSLEGDSVELFFDTRDLKEIGSLHRFCHHFVFLPKEVDGVQTIEMTKLRAEESRPLCEPKYLQVKTTFLTRSYEMRLFIDRRALYGFDEKTVHKIGFMYRINRKGAPSQHFNVSSTDYMVEKYPHLWASLKLSVE